MFEKVMAMMKTMFQKSQSTMNYLCPSCKGHYYESSCEECDKFRKMFTNGIKFLFERCKFIQNLSPVLLDSDNIKTDDDLTADKTKNIKCLFKFLMFLIDEE